MLFSARALEFFFLSVQTLDLAFALLELLLQVLDLLFQAAHLGFGLFQVRLDAGFFLLQLLQEFLQLGDVLGGLVQLLLGFGALVGHDRGDQAGEDYEGKGAKHGGVRHQGRGSA
ncbi:hypothetical protein D3C84_534480 [compost metagenome]